MTEHRGAFPEGVGQFGLPDGRHRGPSITNAWDEATAGSRPPATGRNGVDAGASRIQALSRTGLGQVKAPNTLYRQDSARHRVAFGEIGQIMEQDGPRHGHRAHREARHLERRDQALRGCQSQRCFVTLKKSCIANNSAR